MVEAGWQQRFSLTCGVCVLVWLVLLGAVALDPRVYAASLKLPRASAHAEDAPPAPETVHYDDAWGPKGSKDVPMSDPRLAKTAGPLEPEQIHIALAGEGAMFVSWSTGNASIKTDAGEAASLQNLAGLASTVEYGTRKSALDQSAEGTTKAYVQHYPGNNYVSSIFHHVKLEGLEPSTTYYYRCGDGSREAWSPVLSFTTLQAAGPHAFPQRFGLVGDLGQTHNSTATLRHLTNADLPIVILVGDYSYADDYLPYYLPNGEGKVKEAGSEWQERSSFQPRWDAWGRLTEPLFSRVPLMGVAGNHEIEEDAKQRRFQAFETRYRYPYEESGSDSPQYYSFNAAGVHWVMMGSYAPYGEDSGQAQWLRADLAAVDRARTPWVIAVMHSPWYNSYEAHFKEMECMRLALEPIVYEGGVDLVFNGHVHAYERHNRVYDYKLDHCAPHYVTIGDGGNIEKLYVNFVDEPWRCPNETDWPRITKCPTKQEGHFCPSKQPEWSAFREPSFGMGVLNVLSATEAEWVWHRNQDPFLKVGDRTTFRRGDPSCASRRAPPPALA